ncbi:hypothetical protein MTO96_020609 [Rhipicephalus appendiculatus]
MLTPVMGPACTTSQLSSDRRSISIGEGNGDHRGGQCRRIVLRPGAVQVSAASREFPARLARFRRRCSLDSSKERSLRQRQHPRSTFPPDRVQSHPMWSDPRAPQVAPAAGPRRSAREERHPCERKRPPGCAINGGGPASVARAEKRAAEPAGPFPPPAIQRAGTRRARAPLCAPADQRPLPSARGNTLGLVSTPVSVSPAALCLEPRRPPVVMPQGKRRKCTHLPPFMMEEISARHV